jgi:hypothetical protein
LSTFRGRRSLLIPRIVKTTGAKIK